MNTETVDYPAHAYIAFIMYVDSYSPEPGGAMSVRPHPDAGQVVMLPAGVVRNFEEIGDMTRDELNPVRVELLESFVERHGTINTSFARADDQCAPNPHE